MVGRGFYPNQEQVRSTTQRRGSATKPFVSSRRLTTSIAAHDLCQRSVNLPGVVAAVGLCGRACCSNRRVASACAKKFGWPHVLGETQYIEPAQTDGFPRLGAHACLEPLLPTFAWAPQRYRRKTFSRWYRRNCECGLSSGLVGRRNMRSGFTNLRTGSGTRFLAVSIL